MDKDKIQTSSEFWDDNIRIHETTKDIIHWTDSPLVEEICLKKLRIGDKRIPATQWITWVKEKYAKHPFNYGLSLGCGDGTLERHSISYGICKKIDAYDNSEKSIKVAKQYCANAKLEQYIHYEQKDINEIVLEKEKYDLVLIGSAAHHFDNLENIFEQINYSLKIDGLLIINEFIGPSQFQWKKTQLKIINDLLNLLPRHLKIDKITKEIKSNIDKPLIESMNSLDPSEAIRSSEIVPILNNYFQIIERIDYGGTILHLLLQGIVGNFDASKEDDISILKLLAYFEDLLISEKILSSDFTIIVAKKY